MSVKRKALIQSVKLVALVLIFWWILTPFVSLVLWSVAIRWYWPNPIPQELGMDYWLEALGLRKGYAIGAVSIVDAFWNSVTIALIVTPLTLAISLPTSFALARYRIPYKPALIFLFLMPQAFPLQPVYINLMRIFYSLDLVGTIPGVVIAHVVPSLVFAIWINTATFKAIPPVLEEAARISGASSITTFFRVTFPLATPGILASSVFVFLYSFDEFMGTFFIGLPSVVTLPMLLYSASGYNMQFASATAIVLLLSSIVFMLFLERFLKPEYLGRIG
ncbi:MAG: ABC transporter permease subunit [Candidatus Caldarchaeum sp.]|nr:ABC transporter permease subunit [Candidatus Caldarchaeum sp.]